jgi:predicted RND superfamily exporter protein
MSLGGVRVARVAVVVLTVVCAWLTSARLRVSSDVSTLFPESGDATALSRFTRAFGGKDPAVVLVRGPNADDVKSVADGITDALRHAPSIVRVLDRAPPPTPPADPTLTWLYAGPAARARLRAALTPEGMRARLAETRALLLAPAGAQSAEAWLERDPLRLGQIPWESRAELASGVPSGGAFVADEGRARLVVAEPRGSAFDSGAAQALVEDVERAAAGAARPGVTTELAGGHSIAWETEQMLRHDMEISGTLSAVLASVAFVLTFRRVRALAAVLPPLALGTLWTTGLAALSPAGLNAVAVAFAAVVVGVGVDTGVHVYAALLDARREGHPPHEAARIARATTWRPTLTAAAVAALAFASLAVAGLRGVKQLGLLCGAGELLTSVAILLVTPEIGAWIERGPPPAPRPSRWIDVLYRATSTRPRALVALAACAAPIVAVAIAGWPQPADALVAIRPRALPPLVAQEHVHAIFGGRPGQWIVVTADADEQHARARADRVAEALEPLVAAGDAQGFDALVTFSPSSATQRARLAERDGLDLPSRRGELESALRDAGFDVEACAPALDAFAHPSQPQVEAAARDSAAEDALSWIRARHVASDREETLVATYVRPTGDAAANARLRAAILAVDPSSAVTGFDAIDRAMRDILGRDLVLVGAVALIVVAIAMRLALRSTRHALVALATLACEMGLVGLAMRALAVRWHVYDALVLPVLFGVTIDESMFLLHSPPSGPAPSMRERLHTQGPLVAATALTTAAGFAALIACRYEGLRDLGMVGALGVLAGLVAALVVVPSAVVLLQGASWKANRGVDVAAGLERNSP